MTAISNRQAAEQTIAALWPADTPSRAQATITLVLTLADAIDAEGRNVSVAWREYRAALADLADLAAGEGVVDEISRALALLGSGAPLGNAADTGFAELR